MRDFNTRAILLKKYKVSEADLSLVVLTEKFGKINLWMNGIRKKDQKYGTFIDFFSIMEIGIYKQKTKDKNILKNVKILDHNYNIRCDLEKFEIASFMLNAVTKMTETETGEEVFGLLKESLGLLNNSSLSLRGASATRQSKTEIDCRAEFTLSTFASLSAGSANVLAMTGEEQNCRNENLIKHWFFLRLLNVSGYKFELDSCVGCNLAVKEPLKRVLFSVNSGGIVCNICKKNDFLAKNYSDAIFLDYDIFLLIKKLSLSSNFCNLSVNVEMQNKLNFFMNKVINYFFV